MLPVTPLYRLSAMILDFDGTLAELTIDFTAMKRRLAALATAYLEDEPPEQEMPVLEWLDHLTCAIQAVEGRDLAVEFNTRARFLVMDMELAAARAGRLFPFARPSLDRLRTSGLRLAVITRNCAPAVRIVFPDIADHVDVVLTREDVTRPKPDPAHAGAALAALRVRPGETLMVGDHPLDMAAGAGVGLISAGVATGRVSEDVLAEAGAWLTAPDLPALLDMLAARGLL